MFFMLISGLHKILIEIIVQVFHCNNFFGFVFSFLFRLDSFRHILDRFLGLILRLSTIEKKFVCVPVCVRLYVCVCVSVF